MMIYWRRALSIIWSMTGEGPTAKALCYTLMFMESRTIRSTAILMLVSRRWRRIGGKIVKSIMIWESSSLKKQIRLWMIISLEDMCANSLPKSQILVDFGAVVFTQWQSNLSSWEFQLCRFKCLVMSGNSYSIIPNFWEVLGKFLGSAIKKWLFHGTRKKKTSQSCIWTGNWQFLLSQI